MAANDVSNHDVFTKHGISNPLHNYTNNNSIFALAWNNVTTFGGDVTLQYSHVYFVIDCLLLVLSVFGNLWIIYYICRQKTRTTQNISIVSVAIADFLIAAIVMPSYLAVSKFSAVPDTRTPFLCKTYIYMWYWFKTVIAYSLLAMVCDRYYRVTSKNKSDSISGQMMFFLSFIWFFGAAYNIWEIVFVGSIKLATESEAGETLTSRICVLNGPYLYLKHGYLVTDLIVIYLLPLSAILYMYSVMLTYQCKSGDLREGMTGRRRILLSACLVTIYYLCQIPLEVITAVTFYRYQGDYKIYSNRIQSVTKLLETISFSNGTLNFIAFFLCSLEFHQNVMGYLKTDLAEHQEEDEEAGTAHARNSIRKRKRKKLRRSRRQSSGIEVTDLDVIEVEDSNGDAATNKQQISEC